MMSDDDVVTAAADLAERILDQVSVPNQDWRTIASWARELAALADAVAAASREPGGPSGGEEA
jgi:hypothetical protein